MFNQHEDSKKREISLRLELKPDDYNERIFPLLYKLRQDLVELYKETRDINKELAYLFVPEYQKVEYQLKRLEKQLENQFFDDHKPVP